MNGRTWLTTGGLGRDQHFILAHGAGAGMNHLVLKRLAEMIDAEGVTAHRFEFGYMAERTAGRSRRPAPRAETLVAEYVAAIAELRAQIGSRPQMIIGGKSMGGRVACLAAAGASGIAGVAVVGFPLMPPRQAGQSRAHVIEGLRCPALIVQGTRDPFGGPDAFRCVRLQREVRVHWIVDGDHDLKPRRASGRSHEEAMAEAAHSIAAFCKRSRR